MKTPTKVKASRKRHLFAELDKGMTALAEAGQGKRTLRTHAVEFKPAPVITARELMRLRQHLRLSRALFATYLRTNIRTLENWEQGRAKPLLELSGNSTRGRAAGTLLRSGVMPSHAGMHHTLRACSGVATSNGTPLGSVYLRSVRGPSPMFLIWPA